MVPRLTTRSLPPASATLPVIVPSLITVSAASVPVIVTGPLLVNVCAAATVAVPPATPTVLKRKLPE